MRHWGLFLTRIEWKEQNLSPWVNKSQRLRVRASMALFQGSWISSKAWRLQVKRLKRYRQGNKTRTHSLGRDLKQYWRFKMQMSKVVELINRSTSRYQTRALQSLTKTEMWTSLKTRILTLKCRSARSSYPRQSRIIKSLERWRDMSWTWNSQRWLTIWIK